MAPELGVNFSNIGQVSYTEKDIANLKSISKKIKNEKQEEIAPFTGTANSLNNPLSDKDLEEELTPEEIQEQEENKKYINPVSKKAELYDNFHNFYINFFKYLKYFLGTELAKGINNRTNSIEYIKNFSFNYGSQIMASKQYYDGESYELPEAHINLVDIRALDSTQFIQRQSLGKHISNQIVIAENLELDETIFVSTQYYYLNISVEINFESSSELLDYIGNINNHIPLNFTIYLKKYFNYFNISTVTKEWEKEHTTYGTVVIPNNTYTNKLMTYGRLQLSPTAELTNVTQNVSKEDNQNTLTLDFIFGINIPFDVFKKKKYNIKKITTDIDVIDHKVLNTLPFLNTVSKYVNENNELKIGNKSNRIIETIPVSIENIHIYEKYKILMFYSNVNLDSNYNIGYWKKLDVAIQDLETDLDSSEIEQFVPINFLVKNHKKVFIFQEDSSKTKDENVNDFNKLVQNTFEEINNKQNKEIFYQFIIVSSTATIDNIKEEDIVKYYYIIKSSMILAEANYIDNYYNSILLYN